MPMNEPLMTVPASGHVRRCARGAGPAPIPRSSRGRVLTALGRALAYATTPAEWTCADPAVPWATKAGFSERERLSVTAFGRKCSERFLRVRTGA